MAEARIKKISRPAGMPQWMDCGWRRESCNKTSCKLCGRILGDRQKHIERGEDPDDMKSVLEDAGNSFREAIIMIKKDAERMGIDIINLKNIKEPPEPKHFPLYRKIDRWRKYVLDIVEAADRSDELWLDSTAGADLLWYAHTVTAKTYRQLCNRWEIERGDRYGDFDYKYTKYVLERCFSILKKSLAELSLLSSGQKAELMLATGNLAKLEESILGI